MSTTRERVVGEKEWRVWWAKDSAPLQATDHGRARQSVTRPNLSAE